MNMGQYTERNMDGLVHELREVSDKLFILSHSIPLEPVQVEPIDEESYKEYMKITNKVQQTLMKFQTMASFDVTGGEIHEKPLRRAADRFFHLTIPELFKAPLKNHECISKYATDYFVSTRLTKLLTCTHTIKYVSFLEGDKLDVYNGFKAAVYAYANKLDNDQTRCYMQHT